MKSYLKTIVAVLVLGILSCSKKADNNPVIIDPSESVIDGTWILTSAYGNIANMPPQTKFDFKQTIVFNSADSSFTKTYVKGDQSKIAKGKFSFIVDSSTIYYGGVMLRYNEKNDLIESCFDLREYYSLKKNGELVGDWEICDGSKNIYNRK